MRIFISYKFSGVAPEVLASTVVVLIRCLRDMGCDVFCNLESDAKYVSERYDVRMIMADCFNELVRCTHHVSFVAPDTPIGEGMPMELGYALAKGLKTILLLHTESFSTSMVASVDRVIRYTDMDHLLHQLRSDPHIFAHL